MTIAFDSRDDGIMHNLRVTGSGVDQKTEVETGPTTRRSRWIWPGSYSYACDVHPQQMKGDLEVT